MVRPDRLTEVAVPPGVEVGVPRNEQGSPCGTVATVMCRQVYIASIHLDFKTDSQLVDLRCILANRTVNARLGK